MPATNPARNSFASVLEVNTNDAPHLLARLGEMAKLAVRAEQQVRATPRLDPNRYLSWKPEVWAALGAISLVGDLSSFVKPLQVNGSQPLERLQYCADGLWRERGEKELEEEELKGIQKEINDLEIAVREAEIDGELKLYLMEQLRRMTDAISQYHLFGLDPLQRAINETLGSLMLNPEARQRMSETPLGERFWKVVGRLASLTSVIGNSIRIVEAIRTLLPPM